MVFDIHSNQKKTINLKYTSLKSLLIRKFLFQYLSLCKIDLHYWMQKAHFSNYLRKGLDKKWHGPNKIETRKWDGCDTGTV